MTKWFIKIVHDDTDKIDPKTNLINTRRLT